MNNVIRTAKKAQQKQQNSQQRIIHQSNTKIDVHQFQQNEQTLEYQGLKHDISFDTDEECKQMIKKNPFKKVQSHQVEKKILSGKMPVIDINPQIKNEIDTLRQLAAKNILIRLSEQNLPFYSGQDGFMEYLQKEQSYLSEMEKICQSLAEEAEHYKLYLKSQAKYTNPINLKETLTSQSTINKSKLKKLESQIASQLQKIKKINQTQQNMIQNLNKTIVQIQQEEQKGQTLQIQLKQKEIELIRTNNVAQNINAKYLIDKFEVCIIKLQSTNTLYRYGAKVITCQIKKINYFMKNYAKWQSKVKNIDLLDLKIFIIATLYPMCDSIFNDFSSQSNVYKVMFGLNFFLTQDEVQSSFIILNKRIEKYYTQKKYSSLQGCLKANSNLRKRKIVMICSEKRLDQIILELINELIVFKNTLILISKVEMENIAISYEKTAFSHKKLTIEFNYQGISMKIAVDVLFCDPSGISKAQIQILRMKTGKYEPVLCWFQIPRVGTEERIQIYKEVNLLLNKCKLFYRSI